MRIESQLITFFISVAFCLLGVFNYLITGNPYPPLFITSFIGLIATVGIDLINRFFNDLSAEFDGAIDKDVLSELNDLKEVLKEK